MTQSKPLPPNAKLTHKGRIFEFYEWEQKMYDGSTVMFEKLRRVDTAEIIAVADGKILLQKQEQPSLEPFICLPGGRCESYDEPALEAAKRELLEETGMVSHHWMLWKTYSPFSKIIWTIHTFIALDCKKVAEPKLDSGEKIENFMVTLDELLEYTEKPEFRNLDQVPDLLLMKIHPWQKDAFAAKLGLHQ